MYVTDALVQYADDAQVLVSGPKSAVPALASRMERAISSLGEYFHSNGLKVNVNKFELITFVCGGGGLKTVSIEIRSGSLKRLNKRG